MSIPENSPCRGCASSFATPVRQQDTQAAQTLVNIVHNINCVQRNPPLPQIRYRIGTRNSDVTRHVIRWDTRPPSTIMENGFQPWPQRNTPDAIYYDLYESVQNSGAPLDRERRSRHAFVATTIDLNYHPSLNLNTVPYGRTIEIYRYEIYAPGGIWVSSTLGDQYNYLNQLEVSYVGGIAPQYIRSAQLHIATRPAGSRRATLTRANNVLILNAHFSPLSHPDMHLIIEEPIFYYMSRDANGRLQQRFLSHQTYSPRRQRRQVSSNNWEAALQWYGTDVANVSSYIDAAFRSSYTNKAYIFMKNEYVLLNYAPHSTDDRILNGPFLICEGFPSVIGTIFEYGIDCAFDTDYDQAFIFSTNFCACIDYAPRTTDDTILEGPMMISDMFPFFENEVFETGIDAAFKSTKSYEAYLFRGDKYALIDYGSKTLLKSIQKITDGFPCLKNTVFKSGIDAAFASHTTNEAYIFKGEKYALINFAPHTTDSYIIDGMAKPIRPNWPSLENILPHKNGGSDGQPHHDQGQANGDDEL